ncbi:MAG: type II toxin-antitoxin system RelE/ParE family toxin [Pseudomonadota bacterium]
MPFRVKVTSHANEAGKKLSPEIRKAAKAALKELALNPYLGKELQAELSGFWSLRFLRYRIIYSVDVPQKIIVVWAIGHRRDIYEAFNEYVTKAGV